MLTTIRSTKNGAGTTMVTTSISLTAASTNPAGCLVVDLAGDLPAALGVVEADGPGLSDWLSAGEVVPADALARLERPVTDGLALLPRGARPLDPLRMDVLASLLAGDHRTVVA